LHRCDEGFAKTVRIADRTRECGCMAPREALRQRALRSLAPRAATEDFAMIRKLKSGEYRLYSRKTDPKTGKRRNLGTFPNRAAAEKHEREVQYFKRH